MDLLKVHRERWNLPRNRIKRILKAIEPEIVHNPVSPYNYYVWFSVDGLRVYASLSPIVDMNECMIFPSKDGSDFDGSIELYVARGLTLSKQSLLFCVNDWLENILTMPMEILDPNTDSAVNFSYINDIYRFARESFPCDCNQLIFSRRKKEDE